MSDTSPKLHTRLSVEDLDPEAPHPRLLAAVHIDRDRSMVAGTGPPALAEIYLSDEQLLEALRQMEVIKGVRDQLRDTGPMVTDDGRLNPWWHHSLMTYRHVDGEDGSISPDELERELGRARGMYELGTDEAITQIRPEDRDDRPHLYEEYGADPLHDQRLRIWGDSIEWVGEHEGANYQTVHTSPLQYRQVLRQLAWRARPKVLPSILEAWKQENVEDLATGLDLTPDSGDSPSRDLVSALPEQQRRPLLAELLSHHDDEVRQRALRGLPADLDAAELASTRRP